MTWRITGEEYGGTRSCEVSWSGGAVVGTDWMVQRVAELDGQECFLLPVGPTFTGSATDHSLAFWTVISQLSRFDVESEGVAPLPDDTPPGAPN